MRGGWISERVGLDTVKSSYKRVPTYTGDYRWLCPYHYEQAQPKIPDRIE